MKLDVPYYSQWSDVYSKEWKKKACGVASVKMVLEYVTQNKEAPSNDALIQEGVFIGGYSKDGWIHDALVALLRNHGVRAYRQEFRSRVVDFIKKISSTNAFEQKLAEKGIEKFIKEI